MPPFAAALEASLVVRPWFMNAFSVLLIRARLRWRVSAIVGVLGGLPLVAQPPPLSSGGSSNPSANSPSGYSNRPGPSMDFSAEAPPSRPWVMPIFYPPAPPLLGAPVPLPSLGNSPRRAAPPELIEYVNEIFYAPLATRLNRHQLTVRQREKLQAYRVAKLTLQNELRAKLAALKAADPAARAQELDALAQAQAPRLTQLEQMAEKLRDDLIRGEFFQENVHWDAIRDWRLNASRFSSPEDAFNAQHQVMLSAVFYQAGLLPEQRGLLREIAMELKGVKRKVSDDEMERSNPPLFFSPATSRLLLPPGLPAEIGEKIATFEKEKSALKQELRDTVSAQDRAFFARTRLRQITALAERQWPRLAALEALAEEIRRDLARLPNPPGPPPPPPLPAALSARITAFLAERNEARANVIRKIDQLKKDFPIVGIQSAPNAGGGNDLRLVLNTKSQTEAQLKSLRAALAAFNQENAQRQGALHKEEDAIRHEFEVILDPGDARSPANILDEFADVLEQREDWRLYTDCQAAMLLPGLSPEQRRLLFDAGVESLDLPLPNWDPVVIHVVN